MFPSNKAINEMEEKTELEMLRLSAPLLDDFAELTEVIGACASKANGRYDNFRNQFPFYGYDRHSIGLSCLKVAIDFLGEVANHSDRLRKMDLMKLAKYSEGGALRAMLAGRLLPPRDLPPDASPAEMQIAFQSYQKLMTDLDFDIIPVLKPLVDLTEETYATTQKINGIVRKYQVEFPKVRVSRGYAPSILGVLSAIFRTICSSPNSQELFKKAGVDFELLSRGGAPELPRTTDYASGSTIARLRKLEDIVLAGKT